MIQTRSILALGAAWAILALGSCSRPADLPGDFDARVTSAAARQRGAVLYQQACALCHGERGDGRGARTSSFARQPRDFTSAAWKRSTSPAGVFRAIRDGLPGTPMPAWRPLGNDKIADLTAYVLSFDPPQ